VTSAEALLGRIVTANNARMGTRADDHQAPNPRDLTATPWHRDLAAAHGAIRAEWDAFVADGGRLPLIGDVIGEDQGNQGAWRAGILISRARPATSLAAAFPTTVAAALAVPGIWSALWSVLEPGAELPEHVGPNGGMLRYHLGVRCGDDSGLTVGTRTVAYRDGEGVLFDDTAPHHAWNHGPTDRTTLFLEIVRPAHGWVGIANRAVQRVISLDPRYRRAPQRADEWDHRLNGSRPVAAPGR
jgi:beta-hydroxylase